MKGMYCTVVSIRNSYNNNNSILHNILNTVVVTQFHSWILVLEMHSSLGIF